MSQATPIRYSILPVRPEAHLFQVTCTVRDPDPQGQRFALPAWSPGSYLIRDYARNVVSIRARSGGRPLAIAKLDKQTWRAAPAAGPVTVAMEVYAWDSSVRGAYLDARRGFFNGPSVFVRALGKEDRRCEIDILRPRGARYRGWRIATAMRRQTARPHAFGGYVAQDYDELIDHPVEMGEFALASFRAFGVLHEFAISGRHEADIGRLRRDLKRLCEHHIRFWNGSAGARRGAVPAPMDRYVFLVSAVGEGHGGLEHQASCALACSRNDLPRSGERKVGEEYRGFLGLASHEYFHAWNVKRLRPAAFSPYDLDRENYTTLLWLFEGFTSYYDDLALVRSGLISRDDYLELLGRNITALLRTPGRKQQTVAESSFDAWIKFYRQDENSPNATVSYYLKGALIALCLDLHIRKQTKARRSLDNVMRALWRRHGARGIGVEDAEVERLAEESTGVALRRFFDDALRSTKELPLKRLLSAHGVNMELRPAESSTDKGGKDSKRAVQELRRRPDAGLRVKVEAGEIRVTHVLEGGAALAAGMAAGDIIVAVNGIRVGAGALEAAFTRLRPGQEATIHSFRRDELNVFRLRLQPPAPDTCSLSVDPKTRSRLLARWLGERA